VIPADKPHFAAEPLPTQWTASGIGVDWSCTRKLLMENYVLSKSVQVYAGAPAKGGRSGSQLSGFCSYHTDGCSTILVQVIAPGCSNREAWQRRINNMQEFS